MYFVIPNNRSWPLGVCICFETIMEEKNMDLLVLNKIGREAKRHVFLITKFEWCKLEL
jgi:hypothetical protein